MDTDESLTDDIDEIAKNVENLVPSKLAWVCAFCVLFLSGIAGGFIGYAIMKVFISDASGVLLAIGTCVICAGIIYGVSVITSLGLSASVEWKARKIDTPNSKRPSRLLNQSKASEC